MEKMKKISSVIHHIVHNIDRSNPDFSESTCIQKAWRSCIEEEIQTHVDALYIVPNTHASELIVYVDSSIWATELGMYSELVRLKLNIEIAKIYEEMGKEKIHDEASLFDYEQAEQIKSVKFLPSKDKYRSYKNEPDTADILADQDAHDKVDPIALTDDELDELKKATLGIKDENMRNIALKAAKTSLEYRKGREIADEKNHQ